MPPAVRTGVTMSIRVAFDSLRGRSASEPSTASRTCSDVSKSKPSSFSIVPSTRNTFQPGRVSPAGRTTPRNDCTRPSQLTNVPDVSVNGAIGSSTSA